MRQYPCSVVLNQGAARKCQEWRQLAFFTFKPILAAIVVPPNIDKADQGYREAKKVEKHCPS